MLKELWEVVCQSAKINLLFTMEYVIKVVSSISLLVSKALLLVLGVSFHGNNIFILPCTLGLLPTESEAWHIFYSMLGWCSPLYCGKADESVYYILG